MQAADDQDQITRVAVYSNTAEIARIREGRRRGDWFVDVDAPAHLRGRTTFATCAAARAFMAQLDRQIMAAGFSCLWRTSDVPAEPLIAAVQDLTPRADYHTDRPCSPPSTLR